AALAPDLVIVARFSHLFDSASIAVPRHGILNVHPGRLPGLAGLHAPLRAVISGAGTFGCSIHWITPGIDDGPLLGVIDRPIDLAGTLLDQTTTLYPRAIPTLLAIIEACAAGQRPPGTPQDLRLRRYASMPGEEHFTTLRQVGMRLWQPDALVSRLKGFLPPGMALPPLPGALR
ncbi:MAG TPA: formyltransferase family protein, partial [Zoogloea sp.]|nr:formyltransferase family protein [Zoogloea sp.]